MFARGISGLNAGVKYEELRFAFLADDKAAFEQALKLIKPSKAVTSVHLARYADFDAVFDAIIEVKKRKGVINSALALKIICELALERLNQMEATSDAWRLLAVDVPA